MTLTYVFRLSVLSTVVLVSFHSFKGGCSTTDQHNTVRRNGESTHPMSSWENLDWCSWLLGSTLLPCQPMSAPSWRSDSLDLVSLLRTVLEEVKESCRVSSWSSPNLR
jgi:hypothetical protein